MISKKKFSILPVWCSYTGFFLMVIGAVLLYYFVYLSIKPDWLQLKVFTIYSKYLKTTKFDYIINNQGDELASLVYFFGFLLMFFSKTKKRNTEYIKVDAIIYTFLIAVFVFMVAYILVHGMAIFFVSMGVLYAIPLVFLLIYFVLKFIFK